MLIRRQESSLVAGDSLSDCNPLLQEDESQDGGELNKGISMVQFLDHFGPNRYLAIARGFHDIL